MIPLADGKLTADVWLDVLNKHCIEASEYDELLDGAISLRVQAIKDGKPIPQLAVELMLTVKAMQPTKFDNPKDLDRKMWRRDLAYRPEMLAAKEAEWALEDAQC